MGVFAYIKNGVKYKMNQFPGAYPASRVSYNGSDVETALDELNADIAKLSEVVSVTANGTETYAQLLTRLNGLIDRNKVTPRAVVNTGGVGLILNIININSNGYIMGGAMVTRALPYTAIATIYSNNSMLATYENGSYSDISSQVASGTVSFYY